ncbi:MAG: DnaA/Hda family protein [Phycisphaerales bacterium]|nr:DnaA/Hda family protein [Phycisphaerales bacterium]
MPSQVSPTADSITDLLSQRLGQRRHAMWFGQARLHLGQDELEVQAGSQFAADWIHAHFERDLKEVAEHVVGSPVKISVGVRDDQPSSPAPATPPPPPERRGRSGRRPKSGQPHRLDDFVVGPSNELAWSAASRVAGEAGTCPVSPLFIHGGCGLGKTHLLQGICRRYRDRFGSQDPIRYLTGEQFTNEYIAAVRESRVDEFRRSMRRLALLAIDDIHFLGDKVKTQAEFLHTLDAIHLTGSRIILASDAHPHKIRSFTKGLVSRFLSGMVVEIEQPNRDTRRTLILRLARNRGLSLEEASVELIASRCVGSVREIQGALTRLSALVQVRGLDKGRLAPDAVSQVFEHSWESTQPIGLNRIVEVVCQHLHLTQADLTGRDRGPRVSLGRGLVACLARRMTDFSYPEIARTLGRRNHSSAHAAACRIEQMAEDGRTARVPGHGGHEDGHVPVRELLDRLRHTISHR